MILIETATFRFVLLYYDIDRDGYISFCTVVVAFKIYDIDRDGYISNGELFQVLKMMVGTNLKDAQLQQIVDKTIINADTDGDGKVSFEEFCMVIWTQIQPIHAP